MSTVRVLRRCFHASARCRAIAPAASALETAARRWVQSRTNPNTSASHGNLDLSFALLRNCHSAEASDDSATESRNIVISPFELAQRLNASNDRDLIKRTQFALDAPIADTQAMAPVLESLSGSESVSWQSSTGSVNARFTGLLAPRFALTDTASPSWFIPSIPATVQQQYTKAVSTTDPYPSLTNVTPLERAMRVPATMIYRTDKLWYVEDTTTQIIDVPYLHPHFSLTLLLPRFSDVPTIDNHPQPQYANAKRQRSTIDTLIHSMNGTRLAEALKHATLMQGLTILPTFEANYTMELAKVCPSLELDSRSSISIGASMTLSGAGLQRGGLRQTDPRQGPSPPRFLASAHRPFVAMIRHRPTNTVINAVKVEQVHRETREYKFRNRRIQWIEDSAPIKQFE